MINTYITSFEDNHFSFINEVTDTQQFKPDTLDTRPLPFTILLGITKLYPWL